MIDRGQRVTEKRMATDIALFPIPNLVAFPGIDVPLHVFEPRYRTMVQDAVREGRMIGVTHTRKKINNGKGGDTVEEVLSSNQATYQPHEIFSAGHCEVVEQLEDGRIHAVIHAQERFRIVDEVQTLPYRIVTAVVVADEPEDDLGETFDLQEQVNNRLIQLLGDKNQALVAVLKDPQWFNQPPAQYSFRLFQILNFEADIMQNILEAKQAGERLRIIDSVLEQVR